jgi:GntR family transcriptional regulator
VTSKARPTTPSFTHLSDSGTGRESRARLLRDRLVAFFEDKDIRPGDRLPSEEEIADFGQVGRSTVREALKLLEQEGLVTVRHGKGRYLSSLGVLSVERPIARFESQTDMLKQLGYAFSTLTLSVYEGVPTDVEREALELSADAEIVRIERLRSSGSEPLIYSVCAFPRGCIAGPVRHVDWTGSLHELLAAQGYAPASSSARLRAVTLPVDVARTYSLDASEPWLLITETVINETGLRIVYALDYHRGDQFSFNVLRSP